jgi:hypothetical protein
MKRNMGNADRGIRVAVSPESDEKGIEQIYE